MSLLSSHARSQKEPQRLVGRKEGHIQILILPHGPGRPGSDKYEHKHKTQILANGVSSSIYIDKLWFFSSLETRVKMMKADLCRHKPCHALLSFEKESPFRPQYLSNCPVRPQGFDDTMYWWERSEKACQSWKRKMSVDK